MPSYKAIVVSIFLSIFFISCSIKQDKQVPANIKLFEHEDTYIMYALEYEKQNQTQEARKLYFELFNKTNRFNYLNRFLTLSMQLKNFKEVEKYSNKYLESFKSDKKAYESLLRLNILSLLKLKKKNEALKKGKILLNNFNSSQNYELIANIYFLKEDYEKAEEYFESAYLSNIKGDTLINLVNVLYAYLNKKEKAISYLETHSRLYGCEGGVCAKLYSLYYEDKNIDGIISVLKRSYFEFRKDEDLYSMDKSYKLLMAYLEKKGINSAIEFLEENSIDDEKLLSLYQKKDDKNKALKLLEKLYKKSGNIDLLAQIAILEFEVASNKKEVVNSVVSKFEDALIVLDNHIYQNFLGYLLIDYDIDINKGIFYVQKALKKSPDNVAYLDSLAWGLYKKGDCKGALKYMKQVVEIIGLDEEEIKLHWNKIKECK